MIMITKNKDTHLPSIGQQISKAFGAFQSLETLAKNQQTSKSNVNDNKRQSFSQQGHGCGRSALDKERETPITGQG